MTKRVAIGALFLIIGCIAVYMAFYVSSEIRRGKSWPTVDGKILERGVGERMTTRNNNYLPHVKYAYTVEGKHYVNDQVYLIARTGNLRDKVEELVNSLPDPVPVHYNPDNPAESFLIVNPMTTFWLTLLIGGLGILIGLAQLLVVLTKKGTT